MMQARIMSGDPNNIQSAKDNQASFIKEDFINKRIDQQRLLFRDMSNECFNRCAVSQVKIKD